MTTAQLIVLAVGLVAGVLFLTWRVDVHYFAKRSRLRSVDPARSLIIEGRPDRGG